MHAGDPVDVAIPVYNTAGVAQSLSGWSASAKALDVAGQVLHDFAPSIVSDQIRVIATSAQTGAWAWQTYAARLVVTATPAAGAPLTITSGWIRFYPH